MSYQVGMALNMELTGEEIELLIAAVENRADKVLYDGNMIEVERDILGLKYGGILAKLQAIKGELK